MFELLGIALSTRSLLAGIFSFVFMLICGKAFIQFLQRKQWGQVIRDLGPESHYSKKNTPTMGGILILLSIILSCLIFGDLKNLLLWMGLFVLISMGMIGGIDDGLKILKKNHRGLSARWKYGLLSVVAVFIAFCLYRLSPEGSVHLPVASREISLGAWIILLNYFVLTGSGNAVNLSDGQDGLVSTLVAIAALVFVIFAWTLPFHGLLGSEEIGIFGAAIVGASLGFLWFNAYPASVFMGDVGSLALGGALGFLAMVLRLELLYLLIGFVFVMEALSVILQVGYFKLTKGKRIFKMAPIHHHFELLGIPESKVTMRFCLVGLLCGILSFWVF